MAKATYEAVKTKEVMAEQFVVGQPSAFPIFENPNTPGTYYLSTVLAGPIVIHPGDYAVQELDTTHFYVMDAELFTTHYRIKP